VQGRQSWSWSRLRWPFVESELEAKAGRCILIRRKGVPERVCKCEGIEGVWGQNASRDVKYICMLYSDSQFVFHILPTRAKCTPPSMLGTRRGVGAGSTDPILTSALSNEESCMLVLRERILTPPSPTACRWTPHVSKWPNKSQIGEHHHITTNSTCSVV
jgi:hypothetical protein